MLSAHSDDGPAAGMRGMSGMLPWAVLALKAMGYIAPHSAFMWGHALPVLYELLI